MKSIHMGLFGPWSIILVTLSFVFGISPIAISQSALLQVNILHTNDRYITATFSARSGDSGQFVLGNQNYRIYYNAATLELSSPMPHSHLGSHQYDLPAVTESGVYDADIYIKTRRFEKLGFLSCNISLVDQTTGGMSIGTNQTDLISLRFRTKGNFNIDDIVIAHPETTGHVATAHTELSSWVHSSATEATQVTIAKPVSIDPVTELLEIKIGPNPTADFIYLSAHAPLSEVTIYSASGDAIITTRPNDQECTLDLTGLVPGLYFIEMQSVKDHALIKEIIKT